MAGVLGLILGGQVSPVLAHSSVWVSDLSFPTPAVVPTSPRCPTISSIVSPTHSPSLPQDSSCSTHRSPSQAAKPDLNWASSCSPPLVLSYLPSELAHAGAGQARRLGGPAAIGSRDLPSVSPHGSSHTPAASPSVEEAWEGHWAVWALFAVITGVSHLPQEKEVRHNVQ